MWIGVKYLLSHDFLRSKVAHDNHPFCQYQSQNRPLACYSLHFRDHRRKKILLILSNNVYEFVRESIKWILVHFEIIFDKSLFKPT